MGFNIVCVCTQVLFCRMSLHWILSCEVRECPAHREMSKILAQPYLLVIYLYCASDVKAWSTPSQNDNVIVAVQGKKKNPLFKKISFLFLMHELFLLGL